MHNKIITTLFGSFLLLGACGGSGGGSGSGVDSSKKLDTLSDSDIVSICEYQTGLLDVKTQNEFGCYAQAASSTTDDAACKTAFDTCMSSATTDPQDCSKAADKPLPACASKVTVGEMEDCFQAMADQVSSANLSCASTDAEITAATSGEPPAACKTLQTKCPDLFGDSGPN